MTKFKLIYPKIIFNSLHQQCEYSSFHCCPIFENIVCLESLYSFVHFFTPVGTVQTMGFENRHLSIRKKKSTKQHKLRHRHIVPV